MAEPPPARDETHGADIHHHGSAQHAMATTGQSYRQQDKHGKKQQAEDDPHQCFVLRPLHGPATAAAIRAAPPSGSGTTRACLCGTRVVPASKDERTIVAVNYSLGLVQVVDSKC